MIPWRRGGNEKRRSLFSDFPNAIMRDKRASRIMQLGSAKASKETTILSQTYPAAPVIMAFLPSKRPGRPELAIVTGIASFPQSQLRERWYCLLYTTLLLACVT